MGEMLLQPQPVLLLRLQPKLLNCPVCLINFKSQMTASPRRWGGRGCFIFCGRLEARLWPRDGWRLVGLFVEGFLVFWVFFFRLVAGFAFRSRAGRVGGGRAGLSGGRQTRAGRCGLRDATGRRRRQGWHCCRGLALGKFPAGEDQQSGWEMERPPALLSPAAAV